MKYETDDRRITGMEEVIPPAELIDAMPISPEISRLVFNSRESISQILTGEDPRLLLIVGPCSIHDREAAMEYGARLASEAEKYSDDLLILMRVYFEKPRTIVGWKGLINDPALNNSYQINDGLRLARELLRDLTDLGIAVGTEFLDPITPQYISDLVSWGAIGARTTESQVHRQLASGLSCPVGFKNSTNGSVQVAIDAVRSAAHQHIFLSVTKTGRSAIFSTAGNEDCHIILRGGGGKTNYDNESITSAARTLTDAGLPGRLMVDASHANSEKQYERQITVCRDLARQIGSGASQIMGIMIESHLVAGRQDIAAKDDMTYGMSITDACIGWEDTQAILAELAAASRERRLQQ